MSTTALYYNTFISSFNYQSWIAPGFLAWPRTRGDVDDILSCKHSRPTSVGARADPQSTLFAAGSLQPTPAAVPYRPAQAWVLPSASPLEPSPLSPAPPGQARHQGRQEPLESSQLWKAGPAWGGPYVLGGAYGGLFAGRDLGLKRGLSGRVGAGSGQGVRVSGRDSSF